ncbi:hypothetical protein FRC11_014655, partial [Ceratobasidium sp. 423]
MPSQTVDSNAKSCRSRKPADRPTRRRGYHCPSSQTETTPRLTAPLPKRVFCSTPPRLGRADTGTPSRRSAGDAPCVSSKTNHASYTQQSHQSMTAAPKSWKQDTMDIQIEDELRDTIFHDPNFVQRFLSSADEKLQAIDEHCRTNDPDYNNTSQWSCPERVSQENHLYQPILDILNKIKRAVDVVHGCPPNLVPRSGGEPLEHELFIDNHLSAIDSDLANTSNIKPDIVLFQDDHRHWEDMRMPVEVKQLPGHHKAGMKQLSRYARAVFAHQLHRRHLYGMMVCGCEATFVRFDRAGTLYSGRINIVEQSELFTHAFASLLMLDRVDEGLDPAFTFDRNENGRLVYYIDLPESELAKLSARSTSTKNKHSMSTRSERMRRFEVIERLCHRQSICGRATIVLRIREVLDSDQQAKTDNKGKKASKGPKPREYALKLIWRDPQRDSEGDVLEQVHGMFGLAQHAGHWDVSMPGKCRCPTPVAGRCKDPNCVDKTVEVDGLEVCERLRDISILVPEQEGEEEEPGYWGLFNLGIMHRDISDGNVMMLSEGQGFDRKEWKERRGDALESQVEALFESERMLGEVLE